jgi:mannose-1-phosphate guanylyltransferase
VDDRPLIADTLRRLRDLIPPQRVLVMTSRDIADAIHAAIPEVPAGNMLAEPSPMGTAASLAWAAAEVKRRAGPDAILCATHADIAISLVALFHSALLDAVGAARESQGIVLLGIAPTRAETGFGYIVAGEQPRHRIPVPWLPVAEFIEKPAQERAAQLVSEGALWNSGVFVASVRTLQRELRSCTPEVEMLSGAMSEGDVHRLAALRAVESISLEKGLFERSNQLAVVRGEFTWDDVGTWASLRRARDLDDLGNGTFGQSFVMESSANIVHNESGATVLYGVDDLLVVRLRGLTFVTTLEQARDLRPLLDQLPDDARRSAGD